MFLKILLPFISRQVWQVSEIQSSVSVMFWWRIEVYENEAKQLFHTLHHIELQQDSNTAVGTIFELT